MTTRVDIARMLFGKGTGEPTRVGGDNSQVQARWGTVTQDLGEGWFRVKLDGTEEEIEAYSDSFHNVGDRVQVVWQGNIFIIIGNKGLIDKMELDFDRLAEEITTTGQAILDEVMPQFEEFKEAHRLTDGDITKTIEDAKSSITETFEGKIEDIGETYATKAEFERGIEGLASSVEETYSKRSETEQLGVDLRSEIRQTSEGIESAVEREVTGKLGNYYTKTDWQQGADSFTRSVNAAVKTAEENEKFIETHFDETVNGIDVYANTSQGDTYIARMAPGHFAVRGPQDWDEDPTIEDLVRIGDSALTFLYFGYPMVNFGIIDYDGHPDGAYVSYTGSGSSYWYFRYGMDWADSLGQLRVTGYEILYRNNSGTSAAFTLSESIAEYLYIEVVYTDGTRKMDKRAYKDWTPSATAATISVALDRSIINTDTNTMYVNAAVLNINGRSATFQHQGQAIASNNGSVANGTNTTVRVLAVMGWR